MKDFLMSALPFTVCGICIALIAGKGKKAKENYSQEGMCLGMCFGVSFGTMFGSNYLGLFLSLGMLVGETIGFFIEKNK